MIAKTVIQVKLRSIFESLHSDTVDFIEKRGLRAQLDVQSLITGKLMVQLLLRPDTPIQRTGANDRPHMEMPTIASPLANLRQQVENLPLEQLIEETHQILKGAANVINGGQITNTIATLATTVASMDDLVSELKKQITPTAKQARSTFQAAEKTLRNVVFQYYDQLVFG